MLPHRHPDLPTRTGSPKSAGVQGRLPGDIDTFENSGRSSSHEGPIEPIDPCLTPPPLMTTTLKVRLNLRGRLQVQLPRVRMISTGGLGEISQDALRLKYLSLPRLGFRRCVEVVAGDRGNVNPTPRQPRLGWPWSFLSEGEVCADGPALATERQGGTRWAAPVRTGTATLREGGPYEACGVEVGGILLDEHRVGVDRYVGRRHGRGKRC